MTNTRPAQPRRLATLLSLLFIPFLLTGCFKFTMDLEVSADDTISGTAVVALSKELQALAQGEGEEPTDAFAGLDGVEVTTFDDGTFVGQQYEFSGLPIEDWALDDDSSALTIKRDGDNLIVSGSLSFEDEEVDPEAGEDFGFGQAFFDSADLRVSIKFPGQIVETNGEINEETNTITWKPKYGEANELNAVIYAPRGVPIWVWVALASAVGVALLAAVLTLSLRRISNKAPIKSDGGISPETENRTKGSNAESEPIENVRFSYTVKGGGWLSSWLGFGAPNDLEVVLGRDVLRYGYFDPKTGKVSASEDIRVTEISEAEFISDAQNGMAVRLTVSGGIVDVPAPPGDGKTLVKLLKKPLEKEPPKPAMKHDDVPSNVDGLTTLEKLYELKKRGVLSDEEFLRKKDEILRRL